MGSRTFSWFTPQGRRPTEYELYTVGHHSTPDEWLKVGWPLRFDDGRAPYIDESTKVRSSRWRDWRDPSGLWQRPYVQVVNFEEQALDRLIPAALGGSGFASMNATWLAQAIGKYYAAWPFAEYGLFLSLCYCPPRGTRRHGNLRSRFRGHGQAAPSAGCGQVPARLD